MPARGTTPTQMRLTDADKAVFEAIRKILGVESLTEAVRQSGPLALAKLTEKKIPKKSRLGG